jgi:hypothetical protein
MGRYTSWQSRFQTKHNKQHNKPRRTGRVPCVEPLERRELLAGDLTTLDATTANQPPVAVDDSLTAYQGTPLKITSAALLANDTDADGDPLKVTLVAGSGPEHGTLLLSSNTNSGNTSDFVYLPKGDFTGTDHFLYFAWDGKAFSAATTVTINVQSIVGLPIARDDYYSTPVNTALKIAAPGVLANDGGPTPLANTSPITGSNILPPSSNLQAELVAGPAPETGTLDFHSDGSFTYTPAPAFTGTATFTYRDTTISATPQAGATDTSPVAGNIATVTIAVKAVSTAPEAHNDYYQTRQNTDLTVAVPGVLGNDRSPVGNPLTAVQVSGPHHGSLILLPNGSFTYTPAPDYVGLDTFVYRASDTPPGSLDPTTNDSTTDPPTIDPTTNAPIAHSSLATVTISVTPINPLPEAHNDTYTATQGLPLSVDPAHGVLANDSAPAGQSLSAVIVSGAQHGTVALASDGSFTYTPTGDFRGVDTFVYRAQGSPITTPPGATGANGEGDTTTDSSGIIARPHDVATVYINVRPLNPPPYAQNDQYAMQQGGVLTIAAPGVLANDKHADNQTLTASPVAEHGPQHGTLVLQSNGSFTYTPDPTFSGIDTFLYQATAASTTSGGTAAGGTTNSSIATVAILVRPLNPPPEARNDTYWTTTGTPLVITDPGVLANDSAAAGHTLTAVLLTQPQQGSVQFDDQGDGGFTYTPPADFTGVVSFTYQAKDNTPLPPTTPPATTTTDATLTVADNVASPVLSRPHDIATVTIFVKPLNAPPEAHSDTYTTPQGTTLTIAAPGVLANDLAPVGHSLSATLIDGQGPKHGTVTLLANGSFTYIPNADFSGADTFAYRANDVAPTPGTTAATTDDVSGTPSTRPPGNVAIVTIYVAAQRPPIEAHHDVYPTGINKPLVISSPGVLANDYGPAGVPLAAAVVKGPEHGDLTLNPDGSFNYTPEQDFSGDVTFTYRASVASNAANPTASGDAGSVATVTIYVLPQDPLSKFVVRPRSDSTDESGPQHVPDFALPVVVGGDAARPQAPTFVVTNDNPGLFKEQPAIDVSGKLSYTPKPNASGSATITVTMIAGNTTSGDTTETHAFTISIDKPHPLLNAANSKDVSDDGVVAPNDALMVINYLNAKGSGAASDASGESGPDGYLDVSGDNTVSPLDALLVINWLNASDGGGEGESAADSVDAETIALLAVDAIDAQGRPKQS